MDLLKLAALDADDLAVLSAHAQDAVTTVGDMAYEPALKRFALVVNRFDWQAARTGQGDFRRRRAGLHFDRVLRAQMQGFALADHDRVLNLLAVLFEPGEAPSGIVTLAFSGEAAVRLQVECIEAALADLGPVWSASGKPAHDQG